MTDAFCLQSLMINKKKKRNNVMCDETLRLRKWVSSSSIAAGENQSTCSYALKQKFTESTEGDFELGECVAHAFAMSGAWWDETGNSKASFSCSKSIKSLALTESILGLLHPVSAALRSCILASQPPTPLFHFIHILTRMSHTGTARVVMTGLAPQDALMLAGRMSQAHRHLSLP